MYQRAVFLRFRNPATPEYNRLFCVLLNLLDQVQFGFLELLVIPIVLIGDYSQRLDAAVPHLFAPVPANVCTLS